MPSNRTQLNDLVFHNQTVLPRTSPGFGEVGLAVAELQGGNYQKAATLAEIAVGKDPQLAAGWLAKTAADVFEATPDDLRKERAVFCMERALECAPSCHRELVGFFVTNILDHYVEVLGGCAVEQLGVWTQVEAQAQTAETQGQEATLQAMQLDVESMQRQGDARRLAATGLVTGLTALFANGRGLKVLSGVASAAAFSEADRQSGDAALLDARANALRVLGGNMRQTGSELRRAAAQHRTDSMLPLLAIGDLLGLAARLLRTEGLPDDTLDPLLDRFTEVLGRVLNAHLAWLQRHGLPVFGSHPESRSTALMLTRIFPGMKRGDIRRLVDFHQPPGSRPGTGLAVLGLLCSFFFEVVLVVVGCSVLGNLVGKQNVQAEQTGGGTLGGLCLCLLFVVGLDRWRAASFRRLARTSADAKHGEGTGDRGLLRRGLLGEQVATLAESQPGPSIPPALSAGGTPSSSWTARVARLGTMLCKKYLGSLGTVALGVALFCVIPPASTVRLPRLSLSSTSLGSGEFDQAPPTPAPTIRRALPVSPATPSTKLQAPSPASGTTRYEVTGIAAGDTLNVRSGPGMNNEVTVRLPNAYRNIQVVGTPVFNGPTPWVQIKFGEGTGWVTRTHLKPE